MSNRTDKAQVVKDLRGWIDGAQSVILTDFRGLNVSESNQLRSRLRAEGVDFRIVKNSLAWRAASELGLEQLEEHLAGPTAMAFGVEDPVAPARVLAKFSKDFQKLTMKAGILDGRVISAAEVNALADLPSRDELLGKVAGGFAAPMTGFAAALSGVMRKFAYAVEGLRQKREAEA
ncbi:MAG: 50S ribosomal protein L10 [Thermaerobacterales bacterium]